MLSPIFYSRKHFSNWTFLLLKAAYTYHHSIKDPGAFTRSPKYTIQILIDSIEAVGSDMTRYSRP